MFEPQFELSSDLEWMLESGQVDRDLLAEALAQEYAVEFVQSARLFLRDIGLARQAVVRAFGAALVNVYRYQHGMGVRVWLYQFLIAEWRRIKPSSESKPEDDWNQIDHQKRPLRELAVLIYSAGLNIHEAGLVLGESDAKIERQLKEIHLNLLFAAELAKHDIHEDRETLDQRWQAAARARSQSWNDLPLDLETLAGDALADATRRGDRRSGVLRIQEWGWVAVVIALAAGLIWGGNGLLAGEDETQNPRVTLQTRIVEVAVTPRPLAAAKNEDNPALRPTPPFEPTPTPDYSLPLSLDSTSEEIRSWMERAFNLHQNIWLDADLRLYYPQSSQGFPKEYRLQFWLDNRQSRFLILSGPLGVPVQEIFLNLNGQSFQAQSSESGSYDFLDLAGGEGIQGYYLVFQSFMSHLNRYEPGDLYIPQEVTRLLDQSVLIVDQVNQAGERVASLMLDINSGLALRQRYYNTEDQSPLLDVDYRNLSINPRFPNKVFALDFDWDGAYPVNQLLEFEPAKPESLEAGGLTVTQEPPPGYNPYDQSLHFEFEFVYPLPIREPNFLDFRARIFTDEYYLGEVEFVDPWVVICDRSSDGGKLAYANTEWSTDFLYWFDLKDLVLQSHQVNGTVSQLAFSPDGQRLAYFTQREPQGDLHVLNI